MTTTTPPSLPTTTAAIAIAIAATAATATATTAAAAAAAATTTTSRRRKRRRRRKKTGAGARAGAGGGGDEGQEREEGEEGGKSRRRRRRRRRRGKITATATSSTTTTTTRTATSRSRSRTRGKTKSKRKPNQQQDQQRETEATMRKEQQQTNKKRNHGTKMDTKNNNKNRNKNSRVWIPEQERFVWGQDMWRSRGGTRNIAMTMLVAMTLSLSAIIKLEQPVEPRKLKNTHKPNKRQQCVLHWVNRTPIISIPCPDAFSLVLWTQWRTFSLLLAFGPLKVSGSGFCIHLHCGSAGRADYKDAEWLVRKKKAAVLCFQDHGVCFVFFVAARNIFCASCKCMFLDIHECVIVTCLWIYLFVSLCFGL